MMWNFDKFADSIAFIEENGESYTYSVLQKEIEKLISNIKERCLIFSLCSNIKGSLLGYTAFLNNNIVPVMLDAHLDKELLLSLTDSYKPDYFWIPSDIVCKFSDYESVYSAWGYTLMKTPYNKEFPMYSELAILLTTSGSTGSPKFVRQTYKNINANTLSIVKYLELDNTERSITTLPMSYTYGLSIINSHLYVGASLLLTQKTLMQKEFWEQFKNFEVTSFGGVPYIYEMLDKLRFFRMKLPTLRTMTQAGGKLSPELHKKFAEYAQINNKRFIVMYGQTEATARMSYLPYESSLVKYGSIGIAIPGGEFSLIDADGNKITEAEVVGELVYKGANVTLGYAENGADLIKQDEFNGTLITGDMSKRDSDGYYYIVGRKKRFLKIFGSRVNLDETERIIQLEFPNTECACSGVDDKMTVFITDYNLKENVYKFLSEKTGFNRSAFNVIFTNKIPRNDAGKILYGELNKIDI